MTIVGFLKATSNVLTLFMKEEGGGGNFLTLFVKKVGDGSRGRSK